MFDSSAEQRPQRADQSTIDETEPTNQPTAAIVIRAPATMPAAPQPFEPAGSGPNSNQPGVMETQSTINPLASPDVGGTAGHDAAACVSARGKSDGERVCNARDARVLISPTTLSSRARQVVVPQAQNFRASAAAIALVPQPSTVENAGADAPEVSICSNRSVHFSPDPPVDDEEGWTKVGGKTARGWAKRSAKCGTSVPSVPSVPSAAVLCLLPAVRRPTRSSFRPAAGVTSLDAVAPPVTPSVPSAAVPLPPWGGVAYDRNGAPTHPSVRGSIPVPTPAGVAPFDAVAPSVAPIALRVASTNDSPILQPTGAAPQHSTNDSPISQPAEAARQRRDERHALSKTRLFVAQGFRFVSSGMDPRMANRQALPAQTTIPIVTNDTSSNLKHVEFLPNVTIEEESHVTIEEESPNVTIESPNVTIEESPGVTIEESPPDVTIESPNVTIEESPSATIEESPPDVSVKKSKKQAPEAKDNSSDTPLSPSPSPVDRPVKSGIKPNAAAGTKAQPANNTIFSGDTSFDPVPSATKVKGSKKRQREKKKKTLTTDDGIIAPPVLPPITYVVYDAPNVFTAKDNRAYYRDQALKNSGYSHYVHTLTTGPKAAPTLDGSEPSTHKPFTLLPVLLNHKPLV